MRRRLKSGEARQVVALRQEVTRLQDDLQQSEGLLQMWKQRALDAEQSAEEKPDNVLSGVCTGTYPNSVRRESRQDREVVRPMDVDAWFAMARKVDATPIGRDLMYCEVQVAPGVKRRALLDSGAQINVIAAKLANTRVWDVEMERDVKLTGSTGSSPVRRMKIVRGEVEVSNGGTWSLVFLVADTEYDLLLGIPALEALGLTLSFRENAVFL